MSVARRFLQVTAFICTLLVGTTAMIVIVTQTTWFKEWLRVFIVRQAANYVNGRLSIGRLDGNLFFGVELENVNVTVDGKKVVDIKDAGLNYNALTFLSGHAVLDSIRLNEPVIHALKTAEGWNIIHLIRARTPDPDEPKRRLPIEISEIGVSDGTLVFDDRPVGTSGVTTPSQIDKLDASVGVVSDENELKVDIAHVSFRASQPEFGVNALSGIVRRRANEVILENVSLRTEETSLRVAGTIQNIEGSSPVIDLKASSDKFTVNEFAKLVPALRGYNVQPAFEISASGPSDHLSVTLNAREKTVGQVVSDLIVDAERPGRRVMGTVAMEHLNVAPIARNEKLISDVTGSARIDLTLPEGRVPFHGTYAIDTSRVEFAGYEGRNVHATGRIDGPTIALNASGAGYGGNGTANGTVRIARAVSYDLTGRATNIDLRNLPPALRMPGVPSDLKFEYTLNGTGGVVAGELRLASSTLAGATISPGTVGHFSVGGGAPTYSASGEVANLDVQAVSRGFGLQAFSGDQFRSRVNGTFTVMGSGGGRYPLALDASGHLTDSQLWGASFPQVEFATTIGGGAPTYSATGQVTNLDVQTVGRGFGLQAVSADRFRSRLNATFTIMGSGGGQYPLTLDASGHLTDSQLFGASFPQVDFATAIAGGDAKVRATGPFNGLNPAVITGNEQVAGQLNGVIDAETTIRDYTSGVTIDTFDASGRINLGNSTIAGISIDDGVIDGTYRDRSGNLNQLSITGADLKVQGMGPFALNDTGSSNLSLHLESPSLDRLGKLIDQPLRGAAVVDATVTGNAKELTATGMLKGSNAGYGQNEALSLSSDFTAKIPDLRPADASIQAKSVATFLEVAGQKITELSADTTYSQLMLDFNATAKEGMRQLTAGGAAIFHPDHNEVHLKSLALQSEQIRWQTEAGSEAAIQYAQNRVSIQNLKLVSGDQQIQADGTIGSPSDVLHVTAQNVDVAQLDQLALGDQRLAGRLTADAMISGTTSAPRVAGDFTLTQGAFRQFMFNSFAGKVQYAGRGVDIDVRLDQTSQAWLTAKGYAPLSLFSTNPARTGEVHEVPGPGEAVDIQVASSQIDLGVIQGFTSYVTNVTGAMQANVHVTGSGHDPHLDGVVDIKGGTFRVPLLGTAYTGLDTTINLTPDSVNVSEMRLVDKHQKVLTVGGTLGVHEGSVGAVNIKATSDDFEAVDNEYAKNLRLDADVRISGSMRAPKIEGSIEIDSGTVDVARIFEEATSQPYSVEATLLEPQQPAAPVTAQLPSIFDALDLNVGFAVPSSLVLKGTNLRPANASIDIGDLTATVGGAVQVRKAPGEKVRLTGEVNTVRGSYAFQGRRFEILRDGRIRFSGTEELDPQIDIRARRVIAGVEAFVRVQGTMTEPQLTFTSSPPLDEADILSLIVFNLPINELGEAQQVSIAQRAGALAGSYFASGLASAIGNALELDEFEIQAQGETGASPSLLVGEQVGKRTFVRIRQGFGSEQATEFMLEYQIASFLRMQGSMAEASGGTQRVTFHRIERGGIDLIFFFSY